MSKFQAKQRHRARLRGYSSYREMVKKQVQQIEVERFMDTHFFELPDEVQNELRKSIVMFHDGKGLLKKCVDCGRVCVVSKYAYRFKSHFLRNWKCAVCVSENRQKYGYPKPFWLDAFEERSNELQPYYSKIWEEYIKNLHQGVKVSKLEEG